MSEIKACQKGVTLNLDHVVALNDEIDRLTTLVARLAKVQPTITSLGLFECPYCGNKSEYSSLITHRTDCVLVEARQLMAEIEEAK